MTKKILIVEDEAALSHAMQLKLQADGFTAVLARDGQAALDMLDNEAFDIVLLDIIMPVLDGFKVLENLSKRPSMPIVFVLSNLAQPDDERRVMALGAKKYFVKSDTPLAIIAEEIKQAIA